MDPSAEGVRKDQLNQPLPAKTSSTLTALENSE
jgi:hypothetical protein